MLTFLDDHSRFVTGCRINSEATSEIAIALLEKSGKRYGFPLQVLTDQGLQFHDTNGMSSFTRFCIDNRIQHIVASKKRPTTIGKVERFNRTYEEEYHPFKTLSSFIRYYNYRRINQALGYLTPAQVYFNDNVGYVM